MPTTNAINAKRQIIDLLKAQAVEGSGLPLEGILVKYGFRGDLGTKCIYGGGWRFDQEDAVAEGPGVLVRDVSRISLYVRFVDRPSVDVEVTEAKVEVVVNTLGTILKAHPKLAGQSTIVGVNSGAGDYSVTDDETVVIHSLSVIVASLVTWG